MTKLQLEQMEGLVKMSTQERRLLSIVEMGKELKLSESRVRAILGKDGSPNPVKYGEWYGGGRTANKYDFEEFKEFYKESLRKAHSKPEKIRPNSLLANSFLGGSR